VVRIVHWDISKKHGLPAADKWYEHEPERVVESDEAKLPWDFSVQTDYAIQSRTQDNFSKIRKKTSALLLIFLCLEMPV